MRKSKRGFSCGLVLIACLALTSAAAGPFRASFEDIAESSGLNTKNVFGGLDRKDYILETTGNGIAIFDAEGNGHNDIFIANGTRLNPSARLRAVRSSIAIWAMGISRRSDTQQVSPESVGRRAFASEIMTTTANLIS